MLVSDSLGVIYCHAQKVGSTVWKRALGLASGDVTDDLIRSKLQDHPRIKENPSKFVHRDAYLQLTGMKRLTNYKKQEQQERIENHFKFLIVRNPLERLYSAYHDKFVLKDATIAPAFKEKHPSFAKNMSFNGFLEGAASDLIKHGQANEHWRPFHLLCHPCSMNYDYIGTTESMAQDGEYILNTRLHRDQNITALFNPLNGPSALRHRINSTEKLIQAYANVSEDVFQSVCKAYEKDFRLFGYECRISDGS